MRPELEGFPVIEPLRENSGALLSGRRRSATVCPRRTSMVSAEPTSATPG